LKELKDTGKRITFEGGGQREPKPERFDLMSIIALYREARHYAKGGEKYSLRNWQKGIKFSTCINAIFRHTLKYMLHGCEDEDHLAAARFNIDAIMHFQELGQFEDDDLPHYLKE